MNRLPGVIERFLPIQCYASPQRNYAPKPITQHLFIVQHYFSARYVEAADPLLRDHHFDSETNWRLMRDLNFALERRLYGLYKGNKQYASAHFLICRDGWIWQLVPLEFQAYHAGRSALRGKQFLNRWSIGIENIGHDKEDFTEDQYESNGRLCRALQDRYGLKFQDIVSHSDIAIPHGRKLDPGPRFRWDVLRDYIESA